MTGNTWNPHDLPATLLAVDPGKLTGLVVATWPELTIQTQVEWPQDDFLDWADAFVASGVPDVVICEGYDITMATLKKDRGEAWSIEQRGALRHFARKAGAEFIVQRPMAVLPLVTDDRLAPFGLNKRGGKGHWRDAARHLVYFLAKQGKVELEV